MPLGAYNRFSVFNPTGAAAIVTLKIRRYKFDPTGALAWDTETTIWSGQAVANGATVEGAWQDNTAGGAGWLGFTWTATASLGASGTGNVTFYLQNNTDGTTDIGEQTGVPFGLVPFAASTTSTPRGGTV